MSKGSRNRTVSRTKYAKTFDQVFGEGRKCMNCDGKGTIEPRRRAEWGDDSWDANVCSACGGKGRIK